MWHTQKAGELIKKYIHSLQMFKSRYKTFFGTVKVLQKCHMPLSFNWKGFFSVRAVTIRVECTKKINILHII